MLSDEKREARSELELDRAVRGSSGMLPAMLPALRRLNALSVADLAHAVSKLEPGLTTEAVAEAVISLEEGSIATPDPVLLAALERVLGEAPGTLTAAARVLDNQSGAAGT